MPSRALVSSVLVLLLLPAASALTVDGPPDLEEGDTWTRTSQTETRQGTVQMSETITYEGTESVTVNGTEYEAAVFETERTDRVNSSRGERVLYTNGTRWKRADDHALLKEESTTTAPGFPGGQRQFESTVTFQEPCKVWDWPLEVDKEWTAECTATAESGNETQTFERTSHYRVLREETIEVPAGEFETLVVENATEEEDTRRVRWFAPGACGPAQVETSQGNQSRIQRLASFSCASAGVGGSTNGSPGPGVAGALVAAVVALGLASRRHR